MSDPHKDPTGCEDGRDGAGKTVDISFEVFPPRTEPAEQKLWQTIQRFEALKPSFVSVTYGAGGSTRERTYATVARIRRETSLAPAAHLTLVGATRADTDHLAEAYWQVGVRRLVALRGDAPDGTTFQPHPEGYRSSAELVAGLRRLHDFDISVGAYPEVHPDALSAEKDLDNLKRKLDAGASRAITQLFFDPEIFLRFLERVRAAGITAPIVPGILPIANFARATSFAASCGASMPPWISELFEQVGDDPDQQSRIAVAVASEQCRRLNEAGVNAFHFYSLNRADLVEPVVRLLRSRHNGSQGTDYLVHSGEASRGVG